MLRCTTYTGQPVSSPMRMARLIASSSVQSGHVAGKSVGSVTALGDGLVLEVVDDVAVLAVELAQAAVGGDLAPSPGR